MTQSLDAVVASVAASRRYGDVCAETVQRLATQALTRSEGDARRAAKRTKRALHQIYGAFLPTTPRYERMLAELREARARGPDALRAVLLACMRAHASTRERLPILERFYDEIHTRVGRVRRVLDLGCGLNPLAVPWMQLEPDAVYGGIEIDRSLVRFVASSLEQIGTRHQIRTGDLFEAPSLPEADLGLALKLLPTLEQQCAGAGARLLDALPAPVLIVSFPTHSLGRTARGFERGYEEGFEQLGATRRWAVERIELPGERVYLVQR